METITAPDIRVPIKSWLPAPEIEAGAMDQLRAAANHPEAGSHIAVMPDCHVGYGITIGAVFPTVNAVIPNAVGVDIGCGVAALPTGVTLDPEKMNKNFWRKWSGRVAREIPTGFNAHKSPQPLGPLDRRLEAVGLQPLLKTKAALQVGTLGGGNHFLEAQVDEDDQIWLMVHSGSRHTGLRIAGHYNGAAIHSSDKRRLDAGKDLASLPLDDDTGQSYLADMGWATDFARESRRRMILAMADAFADQLAASNEPTAADLAISSVPDILDVHHNYARLEEHPGQADPTVMVHRKGATSAAAGELGIIPGSMGSASYIVRGKGNPESFSSCSHGAGRRMGRNAAKKAISEAEFAASLEGTYSRASRSTWTRPRGRTRTYAL
jgi:tRNA-splicing ligase RtcB